MIEEIRSSAPCLLPHWESRHHGGATSDMPSARDQPHRRSHDAELDAAIAGAREGDESAWRVIYRTLQPSITGFVRAKRIEDPEALTGEIFLDVVRNFDRFEGSGADLRAWTFTIARRRLIDETRRWARRPRVQPGADPIAVDRPGGDAEEESIRVLEEARLRELLNVLSPGQRDVFLLRVFGGLTIEEIAAVLGKRVGAVKALQRRGAAALRRRLSGPYPYTSIER